MPIVKRINAVLQRDVTEFDISLHKHEDADFNEPHESVSAARGSVSRLGDLVGRSSRADSGTRDFAVRA